MKVLLITSRADVGGGPKHVLDLLKADSIHKEIEYFVSAPENQFFTNEFKEYSHGFIPLPYRAFSFFALFRLIKFCKRNDIRIIHSHGRGAGFYSRLMKCFQFQVIHTFHGVHIETGLKGTIKLYLDRILSGLTDKFICVSSSEKAMAIDHSLASGQKIEVIENGILLPVSSANKTPHNRFTIGILARLSFQKGLDLLIERVSFHLKNKPELKEKILFQIAGDGELKSNIEELLRTHELKEVVVLKGEINPSEGFWKEIDLFLSFSRWEGLPLSVLEAFGAEVPCLLSNVPGNKDLATNGEALLFDLFSPQDFSEKLNLLMADEGRRKDLTFKASERIRKKNNVETMFKETARVYKKL